MTMNAKKASIYKGNEISILVLILFICRLKPSCKWTEIILGNK